MKIYIDPQKKTPLTCNILRCSKIFINYSVVTPSCIFDKIPSIFKKRDTHSLLLLNYFDCLYYFSV